jgi:hypothetical protein
LEPFDDYVTVDDLKAFEEAFDNRKADLVKTPGHYTHYQIEPMTYVMRNQMEFWRGNIVKYASRAGHKQYDGMSKVESEITDLKKAIRYAEARINHLRGEQTL